MIDSEPVPWGKGEKNPDEGSEIELKPYTYKESEPCVQHKEIRSTNIEIRSNIKILMTKIQNTGFEHLNFKFRICFGFRI